VIHCGDLTDFSATDEFEWMRDELERLEPPYVCNIGNHDCLATGPNVFRSIYGEPNFSFDAGDTHFIWLNTNALEFDYATAVPDFSFLEADLAAIGTQTRRTIVAMHAAPYTDQFNNNVAPLFEQFLLRYPQFQLALCGHEHSTCVFYPYDDGIPYYECGPAKHRQYLVFTLTEEGGVDYEVVDY
jgi:3',5'-cyclic AMP phosphodiesterase CpdA